MTKTEIDREFDDEFTYFDEEGGQYILGGYDEKTRLNTDCIPEIKDFIHKVHSQTIDSIIEMVRGKKIDFIKNGELLKPECFMRIWNTQSDIIISELEKMKG